MQCNPLQWDPAYNGRIALENKINFNVSWSWSQNRNNGWEVLTWRFVHCLDRPIANSGKDFRVRKILQTSIIKSLFYLETVFVLIIVEIFLHFLFNFTYVVFPREGLGGGYWGPGCCQIDHLCLFSSSVRPLSKSWQSIGSQSSWRSLLWCVRGAGSCIDNCELHSSSLSSLLSSSQVLSVELPMLTI